MQRHFIKELEKLKMTVLKMAALARRAIQNATQAYLTRDEALARQVVDGDREINDLEMEIDELSLTMLALEQPMAKDLRFILGCTKISNELERAVFLARYNSRHQRGLRLSAVLLIAAKHGLRGVLYVWPMVLLLFVDLPGVWDILRLVLVVLAVAAWFRFIYASVRDDYARFISGSLIEPGTLRRVL